MEVINLKIKDLKPYENNPRVNKEAVGKVANSIKNFGFKVPILLDKNKVIIAGHTRLKAAKKLNLKEVPCILISDLSEEKVKALRLADNKVAEIAMWDWEKLEEEKFALDELIRNLELDFDLEDFGFDPVPLEDDFDEDFDLSDDDKEPFQQITLTLADAQAEFIKNKIKKAKKLLSEEDTFGNTNQNGNAVFYMVKKWAESNES